jgi:hypothetical protein
MEGYEVFSINDDKIIGHVVEKAGDFLIVEHGTLRHVRNALPLTFADVDDANQRVVTNLAADLVYDSPKIENGNIGREAIAAHYGLAPGTPDEGYGVTDADELGVGAEADMRRGGAESVVEQRVHVREDLGGAEKPVDESPALLGDRYSQVPPARDE